MTKDHISFKLKNKLSELSALCRQVEAFAKERNLSLKDTLEIQLCLEEHFTNIITHGYTDAETHRIDVTLAVEGENFIVRIEDDGVPFNPNETPAPDLQCRLEDRKIGGLGVYLTRQYMDRVAYERRRDKNIVVMTKKIQRRQEGL